MLLLAAVDKSKLKAERRVWFLAASQPGCHHAHSSGRLFSSGGGAVTAELLLIGSPNRTVRQQLGIEAAPAIDPSDAPARLQAGPVVLTPTASGDGHLSFRYK